jgi:hypothetical protein
VIRPFEQIAFKIAFVSFFDESSLRAVFAKLSSGLQGIASGFALAMTFLLCVAYEVRPAFWLIFLPQRSLRALR